MNYDYLKKVTSPQILVQALKLVGTKEIVGVKNSETIMGWAKELGLEKIYTNDEIAWYGLFTETVDGNVSTQLAQGNLTMSGEAYTDWTVDNYAWDWIAEQLNLVITGDYVAPVAKEPIPEPIS